MPLRDLTPEEAQKFQPQQGQLRDLTPEEERRMVTQRSTDRLLAPREPKDPGLVTKIVGRALGTDVDDPLELERLGTTVGGAIIGAQRGSRTPALPGPAGVVVNPVTGTIAGGIVGALGGAAAPESILEAGETIGALEEGTRERVGLDNPELKRVLEGELLLEVATGGTAAGIRGTSRGVARLLARPDRELAGRAAAQGVDMAPFQAGEGALGRGAVNVLGRFPLIGTRAKQAGQVSQAQLRRISDEAPSRIAPLLSSSSIGAKIFDDARALVKGISNDFNKRYTDIFRQAEEAGVRVSPEGTTQTAQEILGQIQRQAPVSAKGTPMSPSRASRRVSRFLNDSILPLLREEGGSAPQSLRQMDELIEKIDQEIAASPDAIRRQVARMLSPLRGAAKSDITSNIQGEGAEAIGRALAETDADFSQTMRALFETSTARRFQTVRRRGLRGVSAPSEEATRVPIDKLLNTVLDLDSPQAVDELFRLVGPRTQREIGSRAVANAFDKAIKNVEGGTQLNPEILARELGLSGTKSTRREAFERLLKGSGLEMKDLETVVDAARKMSDAPIPNASTFIARRAMIGGARSATRALIPIAALTGGGAAGGGIGALLGGLVFFSGGRGLIGALSNPVNARALSQVLNEEASNVARRGAFLRLSRAGINGLQEAGEITVDQAKELFESARSSASEFLPDNAPEPGERF